MLKAIEVTSKVRNRGGRQRNIVTLEFQTGKLGLNLETLFLCSLEKLYVVLYKVDGSSINESKFESLKCRLK